MNGCAGGGGAWEEVELEETGEVGGKECTLPLAGLGRAGSKLLPRCCDNTLPAAA